MSDVSRRDVLRLAGTTGLLAMAGGSLLAEDKKSDRKTSDKWRAWAVTEKPQTRLVVEGIYSQGGPGLVVSVREAAPQGINARVLLLDVQTATLPGVWPLVLQPVPGHYTRTPYEKGQFDSVQLRYPDGSVVSIDKIIDAGKGPK